MVDPQLMGRQKGSLCRMVHLESRPPCPLSLLPHVSLHKCMPSGFLGRFYSHDKDWHGKKWGSGDNRQVELDSGNIAAVGIDRLYKGSVCWGAKQGGIWDNFHIFSSGQ